MRAVGMNGLNQGALCSFVIVNEPLRWSAGRAGRFTTLEDVGPGCARLGRPKRDAEIGRCASLKAALCTSQGYWRRPATWRHAPRVGQPGWQTHHLRPSHDWIEHGEPAR